jgi:light-regulated signal transduction histidine kinase (bacteriophytochrome)
VPLIQGVARAAVDVLNPTLSVPSIFDVVAERARELVGAAQAEVRLTAPDESDPRGGLHQAIADHTGRFVGAIRLSGKNGGRFGPADREIVRQIAQLAAVAIHNAQIRDRAQAEMASERRRLESSNAELDQFAYIASHDLKAPLRGIANLAHWIEEDLQDNLREETREMLGMLRSRMQRLEALIDGLLEFSRVGRARSHPDTVNVGSLVGEVIELLAPHPSTTMIVKAGMPTMITDRLGLQQVFMNLIGNAIKYTRREDAQIEIGVHDAGLFYDFFVADNGPGIAPEYHEKIWGIFQTLAPRDEVEGTGIGLSIVKKAVERRGGTVRLDSTPGVGSTFSFLWPKLLPREDTA